MDPSLVLPVALGKAQDGGRPVVLDLAAIGHLLIGGGPGSGKSALIHSMLVGLLFTKDPDALKLILVDPKRVELGVFAEIPHLLCPVVVDHQKAIRALRWAVGEMTRRLRLLGDPRVRAIHAFEAGAGRPTAGRLPHEGLPRIVIVVDEFADLVMTALREFIASVLQLAQMGHSVGIHLVLATQKLSTDVITSELKALIAARAAFRVATQIASRTLLEQPGAEHLAGRGDMLFSPRKSASPVRIHGAFVDEPSIRAVTAALARRGPPALDHSLVQTQTGEHGERDEHYGWAVGCVSLAHTLSISTPRQPLRGPAAKDRPDRGPKSLPNLSAIGRSS